MERSGSRCWPATRSGRRLWRCRTRRSFASQQRRLPPLARAAWLWPQRSPPAGWVEAPRAPGGARRATLAAAGWTRRRCACGWRSPGPRSSSACRGVARRELAARADCAGTARSPTASRPGTSRRLCAGRGQPAGAQRAARTGLASAREHRGGAGASDLRAACRGSGSSSPGSGLRIALATAPGPVLAWAERLRASALRLAPVTPPDDPELRERQPSCARSAPRSGRARAGQRARGSAPRSASGARGVDSPARPSREPVRPSGGQSLPGSARAGSRARRRGLVELIELDGDPDRTDARRWATRPPRARTRSPRSRRSWSGCASRSAVWSVAVRPRLSEPRRWGGARAAAVALDRASDRATVGDDRPKRRAGDRPYRLATHPAVVDAVPASRPSGDRRAVGRDMARAAAVRSAGEADGARYSSPGRGLRHASAELAGDRGAVPGGHACWPAGRRRSRAVTVGARRAPRSPTSPATAAFAPTARCSPRSSSRTAR